MTKTPDTIVSYESRPLTDEERRELHVAAQQPDDRIDTSDIPATGPDDWANAQIGTFYRPVKQQLTLRIDAGAVDWFKQHAASGKGYQTEINRVLVEYVAERRKAAR